MSVQRVYIVRHGETEYNVERRWQGHLDIPLNDAGLEQAQKAAKYLKNETIDAIFASDLSRAFVTAETIAKPQKLEVIPEPRLREMDVGNFQGLTRSQITKRFPEELEQWNSSDSFVPPNGESREQLQERAYIAWQDITNRQGLKSVMLVSHGGTLRMLLKKLFPTEQTEAIRFNNTSISILERDKKAWKVVALNITPHLE